MRTNTIIRVLAFALLAAVVCATSLACTNTPNSDPYGYATSVGQQEAEDLADSLARLKVTLGPNNPGYLEVARLAEVASRHRDRQRRLKVYIVTLRAILDE